MISRFTVRLSHSVVCINKEIKDASRGAGAQVCECKRGWLWVRYLPEEINIYFNFYSHFFALVSMEKAALSSATQHVLLPEIGASQITYNNVIYKYMTK